MTVGDQKYNYTMFPLPSRASNNASIDLRVFISPNQNV